MDTMRERFAAVTSRLLDDDPRLALVLADIGADQFASAAAAHPDRVINVGIREQLLLGVTGGLALAGLRPIAHTFASFLVERPFEGLKLDVGHQDVGAVLVSAGASYDYAAAGRTHQAPGDVALVSTLPGWRVHVPGHPGEAEALLRQAAAADDRVYLRLSTVANREPWEVAAGRVCTVRRGEKATVLAVGPVADAVLSATEGLDVSVVYTATVRPLDTRGLRAAMGRGGDVVIVEPYLAGTSAWPVSEALADLPHRLLALGVDGRAELRRYGAPREHEAAHGLDPASLRRRIQAFLAGRP